MIEAVFISDLHLHPDDPDIKERFDAFIDWAQTRVKSIYILGDFFHAWPGDDSVDPWSLGIAKQLRSLVDKGIQIFFMAGNRDFLLGKEFAKLCGWKVIQEPKAYPFANHRVLLVHGDRYCTKDIAHQRFRKLTRNRLFSFLFLALPLAYRLNLVEKIRRKSSGKTYLTSEQMDVVQEDVIQHVKKYQADIIIHGHTHKPGKFELRGHGERFLRYVLSDWDDIPKILCYHNTKGFYFDNIRPLSLGVANESS